MPKGGASYEIPQSRSGRVVGMIRGRGLESSTGVLLISGGGVPKSWQSGEIFGPVLVRVGYTGDTLAIRIRADAREIGGVGPRWWIEFRGVRPRGWTGPVAVGFRWFSEELLPRVGLSSGQRDHGDLVVAPGWLPCAARKECDVDRLGMGVSERDMS